MTINLDYTVSVYLDGVLQCTSSANAGGGLAYQPRTIAYIGLYQNPLSATYGPFTGAFASLHMWQPGLTANQINKLATNMPATIQPSIPVTNHGNIPNHAAAVSESAYVVYQGKLYLIGGILAGTPSQNFQYFDGYAWTMVRTSTHTFTQKTKQNTVLILLYLCVIFLFFFLSDSFLFFFLLRLVISSAVLAARSLGVLVLLSVRAFITASSILSAVTSQAALVNRMSTHSTGQRGVRSSAISRVEMDYRAQV